MNKRVRGPVQKKTAKAFYNLFIIFIFPGFFYPFSGAVLAGQPGANVLDLSADLEIYEDTSNALTLEEIANNPDQFIFQKTGGSPPVYWMTESAIWARVATKNLPKWFQGGYFYFNHPFLKNVDFYYPRANGYEHVESGHNQLQNFRVFHSHKVILPLPDKMPPGYLYFRVRAPDQPWELRVKLANTEGVIQLLSRNEGFHWAYFAIIISLIIYNFIIFVSIRDLSYLYYVLFHIFFALTMFFLQGYGHIYLLHGKYDASMEVFSIIMMVAALFGALFARTALHFATHLPFWDRVFRGCLYILPFVYLLYPVSISVFIAVFNFLLFTLLIIIFLGGILLSRSNAFARDFTFAWLAFFFMLFLYVLNSVSVHVPFVQSYGLQAASALEALLLSLVLARRIRGLSEAAERDPLTGVYNRRAFQQYMSRLEKSEQNGNHYLIVLDLDNFKLLNDQFGHSTGDDVLIKVMEIVSSSIRSEDFLARWGGEEFALVVQSSSDDAAVAMAEKIRLLIETSLCNSADQAITASFGIARFRTGERYRDLFHRADKALYEAKKSGKNCVKMTKNK